MPEWAELVHAVRCEPSIDAPRLCAADWLLERGLPRGELIVVQCRLANLDLDPTDRANLVPHDLLASHREAWEAPLRALGARSPNGKLHAPLEFRRGFVQAIMLAGARANEFAAICRHEPIIELTVMSAGPRTLGALADTEELAQLRHLALGYTWTGFEAVLRSTHLGALESLALPVPMNPAIAHALARGSARPRYLGPKRWIGALDPTKTAHDLESARVLAAGGVLDRIAELAPYSATDALIEAFARSPLAGLRRLRFEGEPMITTRALHALGDRLDQLEELVLDEAWIPEMAPILIDRMTSRNLRRLVAAGDDGLARVIASPVFARVIELDLSAGSVTPQVARALAHTPYRLDLRRVVVRRGEREALRLDGVDIVER